MNLSPTQLAAHEAARAAAGYNPQQQQQSHRPIQQQLHQQQPVISAAQPVANISSNNVHIVGGTNTSNGELRSSISVSASTSTSTTKEYLWTLNADQVNKWLSGITALFPDRPKLRVDAAGNILIKAGKPTTRAEQEKIQHEEIALHDQKIKVGHTLLQNIVQALLSASVPDTSPSSSSEPPSAKRMKIEPGTKTSKRDEYNVLDSSFASGKDIVHVPGAILTRISLGGMINAMAGVVNGVVNVNTSEALNPTQEDALIPTAQNHNISQLKTFATALTRSIKARLEMDMMDSTPARIVEMLCPEVTPDEMRSIRRRIYDTVVLGKGTNSSANAAALERDEDLPVAARVSMHDIDKVSERFSTES